MTELSKELEQLGVPAAEIRSIRADMEKLDARSLFSELLLRGLWSNVIDETPAAEARAGASPALQRLLDRGVDADDLVDVIREAQIDLIYNVAQMLDEPTGLLESDENIGIEVLVRFAEMHGAAAPIHCLHTCLMGLDPSGRHGEARSLAMRQWQKLAEDERQALDELLRAKKFSAAAVLWRKHVGGDLKSCLLAVQALHTERALAG